MTNLAGCYLPDTDAFTVEDFIDEAEDMDDPSSGQYPSLGDDQLQLLYQVSNSLCKGTLVLIALGPTGSGKTITMNRLTAGLVHLDMSKRKSQVDPILRSDITPDLFGGRQPTCYVREFDFSSLPPNRMLGIAPLDTPLKLAVIDTPGFTNKIQLNEETIMKGFKSLDAYVSACKHSLNSPKAHVFVIYFVKQTWTWSNVDSKIIKAIQAYYGSVGMFCITHSLVVPAFIQYPLPEELTDFKKLDLPDILALREEEETYLGLVSETDRDAAVEKFEKSWVSLYKRFFSLSTHITKIKESITDARIIFFENSPNLASNSDLGLSNLVFRFSRGLNYNYGSFFTILTSFDLVQSTNQYMLLPTSMDRSRINKLPVYREEQELSPFQKHDMEDVRKGQMNFFEECKIVVDDISRDKIYRISRSFFKSSLPTVSEVQPLQQAESCSSSLVPSSSQDSSRSCSSTLSDTDISSSASETSEGSKKVKLKLLGIKALWSDLFESREEGFQFLTEETKNIPTQPNKKPPRGSERDNKNYKSESAQMHRRQSAPLFANLAHLNPELISLLSKKRSSDSTQMHSMYYRPGSSSNDIRLKKSQSESPCGGRHNSPVPRTLSASSKTVPRRNTFLSSSSSGSMSPAETRLPHRQLEENNDANQPVLPSDLEDTIVSLIGDQRKQCMLCKDVIIYSICPKCKRGYCEECYKTFSRFQKKCKFDSSMMENVSISK